MKYLAMLKDSFLEAMDCKSMYVMFVISGVFILFLLGISYEPVTPAAALEDMVSSFTEVLGGLSEGRVWVRSYDARYTIGDIRELGAEEKAYAGGYGLRISTKTPEIFGRLVRHWDAVERGLVKKEEDAVPDADTPPAPELQARFLRQQFFLKQIPRVTVEALGDGTFAVKLRPPSRQTFAGAYRLSVMFGLWKLPLPLSVALFVFVIEQLLSEYLAGVFGVLIGIIFTADFVPNMLQKGRIDLLLARPVSRWTILLYKYLGGLLYAGITGVVFVGGSFLVLSARSGVWNWGYLMSLGTLVIFFAVLSSIGVLTAVVTRNTVATILVPLAAWGLGFAITGIKNTGRNPLSFFKTPPWADSALEMLSWFVPRTSDFNRMNAYFMQKFSVGDEVAELVRAQHHLPEIPWVPVLVSSTLMILVMLSAACWIFSRRDH